MKHNYFSKLLIFTCLFLGFTFSFAKTLEQESFKPAKNSNDMKAESEVFDKKNNNINGSELSSDKTYELDSCTEILSSMNNSFHFNDFISISSKIKCN